MNNKWTERLLTASVFGMLLFSAFAFAMAELYDLAAFQFAACAISYAVYSNRRNR